MKKKKIKINKIKKQFAQPLGSFGRFRYITVYADYSITIGSVQEIDKINLLEVAVK